MTITQSIPKQNQNIKISFSVFLFLVFGLIGGGHIIVSAQSSSVLNYSLSTSSNSSSNSSSKVIESFTFSGEVVRMDGNKYFISENSKIREIIIDKEIKITRDGQNTSVSSIKVYDLVQIELNKDTNEVYSIAITSNENSLIKKWLIPAAIVTAIILLTGIYLLNRSNRGSIKTNTVTYKQ